MNKIIRWTLVVALIIIGATSCTIVGDPVSITEVTYINQTNHEIRLRSQCVGVDDLVILAHGSQKSRLSCMGAPASLYEVVGEYPLIIFDNEFATVYGDPRHTISVKAYFEILEETKYSCRYSFTFIESDYVYAKHNHFEYWDREDWYDCYVATQGGGA